MITKKFTQGEIYIFSHPEKIKSTLQNLTDTNKSLEQVFDIRIKNSKTGKSFPGSNPIEIIKIRATFYRFGPLLHKKVKTFI